MKKLIILLTGLTLAAAALQAQSRDEYDQLKYQEVINKNLKKAQKGKASGKQILELADAYRLNAETGDAEIWYEKVLEHDTDSEIKLHYAQMLLTNGKYEEAKDWFLTYSNSASSRDNRRAKKMAILCDSLLESGVHFKDYLISKSSFNSKYLDFSPMYYNGDSLVFVSNRVKKNIKNSDHWTANRFTDLYLVSTEDNHVCLLDKKVNSDYHDGSTTFSNDGNTMYYTRNDIKGDKKLYTDSESNSRLQIYKINKTGEGDWGDPEKLSFNDNEYSYAHPTVTKNEEVMIFASDRPGGYGGMDLYKVVKDGEEWSEPRNLGQKINSAGNEVFPFLDSLGFLYYSSDLLPGLGGLDIFKASPKRDLWANPTNLGAPLNSYRDDFGIITKDDLQSGYLSSNRDGIDDDIYEFNREQGLRIKGKVVNCDTREAIPAAPVVISGVTDKLADVVSDEEGIFEMELPVGTSFVEAYTTVSGYYTNQQCPGRQELELDGVSEVELLLPIQKYDPSKGLGLCGNVMSEGCDFSLFNSEINLINICNGEEVNVNTDSEGDFYAHLIPDCKYQMTVSKNNFITHKETFTTDGLTNGCLDKNIELTSSVLNPPVAISQVQPQSPRYKYNPITQPVSGYPLPNRPNDVLLEKGATIELHNIYFDYDKYYIRTDARPELNWVYDLMKKYPEMEIEISAHTDSRASNTYNNTLSSNRAKSAREYLIERGISARRLVSQGYGETRLKNNCSDGVTCTEVQHQRNRRVEFTILEFEGRAYESKEWTRYTK